MFRVDPQPIIRSTTLYLQHLVLVKQLLLPAAIVEKLKIFQDSGRQQQRFGKYQMLQIQCCAPDDGWRYHPKHVQQFTEIKNCITLHLVGHTLE